MPATDKSLAEIAQRHGVDIESVKTQSKEERLERLAEILKRTDVPFPVDPSRAESYLELARSNTALLCPSIRSVARVTDTRRQQGGLGGTRGRTSVAVGQARTGRTIYIRSSLD